MEVSLKSYVLIYADALWPIDYWQLFSLIQLSDHAEIWQFALKKGKYKVVKVIFQDVSVFPGHCTVYLNFRD